MTDLKKVITLLDDMRLFADMRVHQIVSPDNWNVYSELCDFIDLTKEVALSLLKAQEPSWISVKDRPPDDHEPVFIYSLGNGIMTAIYTTSGQWVGGDGYYVDDVTHWMPLPEPPKEET